MGLLALVERDGPDRLFLSSINWLSMTHHAQPFSQTETPLMGDGSSLFAEHPSLVASQKQ